MNSCWTCRNRRVQCDQSATPCAKCAKAGIECFNKRPLRWVKGVAIRGKMQGYAYEGKSDGFSKGTGIAKNTRSNQELQAGALVRSSAGSSHLPATLPDPASLNLDRVSRYYIDYYNERICRLFIVYDSERNPFRSLISFGLKDPVLQKAILALAARHHTNTGRSFDQIQAPTAPGLVTPDREALLFKHQAMEALSRVISAGATQKNDITVASIFLLIFLDLLESGSDGWNFHLKGVKSLITSHRPLFASHAGFNDGLGQSLQDIWGFISKQIHLIETLGATFLRPKLLSEFGSANGEGIQSRETIEQSFLGCPDYLLKAIQFLSNERDTIAGTDSISKETVGTHVQDITAMLELVKGFDSYEWASSVQYSRRSPPNDIENLCTLSEAYKSGALLYGQRILDALIGDYTLQDELVSELLGLLCILKDDDALFKCVLWAIFVAGLECRSLAHRDFLVECLEKFWKDTSCLNVINAAKILEGYWKKSPEASSRWIFEIGCLGRDWLLI